MTPRHLVAIVHAVTQAGGQLVPHAGRLRLKAPAPVSPGLVELVRAHKAALLRYLSAPPANQFEPCPHPRVFLRTDGSRLCIQCWSALPPGDTVWTSEPAPAPACCANGHHEPYPEQRGMPGIMQCKHCSHVWREDQPPPGPVGRSQAPCPACGCPWSWPTTRNTWLCAECVTTGKVEVTGWRPSQSGTTPAAVSV